MVCPFDEQWKLQLHNYLLPHDGKYWCMWSHGPEIEDMPTQHVRFATSDDGLKWSESKTLTGPPAEGRAYIARSFWMRDGELIQSPRVHDSAPSSTACRRSVALSGTVAT